MAKHRSYLCPYCGHRGRNPDRCSECGGLFEPLSLKATQIAMGPWFIRDKRVPYRPGCSYEVIKKQVKSGRIGRDTVMRGPTTKQFWSLARNVPGVAHLLGLCHNCHADVKPTDIRCPSCETGFGDVKTRDHLGLRYTTESAVADAQRSLDEEVAQASGKPPTKRADDSGASSKDDLDLLDTVIGPTWLDEPDKKSPASAPPREAPRPPEAAAPTPAPSVATSGAAGQALDFAADETDDTATVDLNASPGISPTVWVLIALNVIGLALLAIVLLYFAGKEPPAPSTPAPQSGPPVVKPTVPPDADGDGASPASRTPPAP